jgi:hypothetical protein
MPYPAEAALHTLVEKAPAILPLAGARRLTMLSWEVRLGVGTADLLAVESSGRLVIIEVKLADNAESRRAVVAQVARSLAEGSFRLVIVLDSAPDELVQVVGYLQSVTEKIDIDLVTVTAYDVGGSQVLVPQRVEPGRRVRGRQGITTLLPRLAADNTGLVRIAIDNRTAYMQFWRSVFDRRAPQSIATVQTALGAELRQGNATHSFPEPLLEAITHAYREAANHTLPLAPVPATTIGTGT